ncbi:LOW QUALITY PROTEIN: uncharacterized protein ACR2FA_002906 [Aphomia sociella]
MYLSIRVLLCAVFVISLLDTATEAKRSFGGGSRHSYPSSHGSSGTHSSHRYPSGGLSGGGHSYPSSGGLSGTGSKPQSHGYPSSGGMSGAGSHGYPSSGGLSGGGGSHGYPSSGGLSGAGSRPQSHGYPNSNKPIHISHTTVHNHYHYSPPQQIRYSSPSGPMSFPVYRSPPPTYVYQYKDSGSKYGTLLAGLALFNLGALAGVAGSAVYAHSHGSGSSQYKAQPGEVCKLGIRNTNGDYEETRIDCNIITSFIFQEQANTQNNTTNNASNTTITTTTVTNVTTVNMTNPAQTVPLTPLGGEIMLPNGTLVPANTTINGAANTTSTSSVTVTTTTTNTTLTNALDVKGKPVEVKSGMKCYIIRTTPVTNMRKTIDCGVLQAYADQSLKRNSAVRNIPSLTILAGFVIAFVVY